MHSSTALILAVAVAVAFALSACSQGLDNQVEKCVTSAMRIGEPYKNDVEKAQQETRARLACLKAAAGKD